MEPNSLISGSIGQRKMDVGFIYDTKIEKGAQHYWSKVLIPGELKE